MRHRLRREEVVTIEVLAERGQSKSEIARALGVTEGTVRYHLKHHGDCSEDGRKDKPRLAEAVAGIIDVWVERQRDGDRPVNVRDLYDHLVDDHDYAGSYKSVLRYMRAKYPKPPMRTYRRVEKPPGAQVQTDWAEYPGIDVGRGPERLHAFMMVLSHSRKTVMVWSRTEDQLGWLWCHNEAFRRLCGIAAVNRVDNVKTAVVRGAGAWGVLNETYRTYARMLGFHIDPCQPRAANAKGKVEAKVRLSRLRAGPGARRYDGLAHLQAWSDARLETWAKQAVCPATGRKVQDSWEAEVPLLSPLPMLLPEPFDVVVTRPVHRDCMVHFEDRQYPVPFQYVGRRVEVRGCAGKVQIAADGKVLREYERHTPERVLVDPTCYEGQATADVLPPLPLGRMGRRLQELFEMPVQARPIDLYAALAEVAR